MAGMIETGMERVRYVTVHHFQKIIVLTLVAIYLVNCLSPLRLTNDTVRYLHGKEWIEAGMPVADPAAADFLPFGYIWFLLLLSKLSLWRPFFIYVIQLGYLLSGLWFVKALFKNTIRSWQLFSLALLNWACLKFVITPLSEMQFFFLSTASLYYFDLWQHDKKILPLMCSLLFCAASVFTRTAGIALVAAYAILLMAGNRQKVIALAARNRVVAAVIAGVLLLTVFTAPFHVGDYLDFLHRHVKKGITHFIITNLHQHLADWACLFLNAPGRKLTFLPPSLVDTVYLLTGLVFFGYVLYLLLHRRNNIPMVVKVYVLCYLGIIINWPYYEPRFFVPVFPMVLAVMLQPAPVLFHSWRKARRLFVVMYTAAGIAAMSYYTYTSLNRKALATGQDAGTWRNEYESVFFGKPVSDTVTTVNRDIIRMLRQYR